MKHTWAFTLFFLFIHDVFASEKYWVSFTDKAGVAFDPHSYFDQRTIQQRIAQNISLFDSTDFPVNTDYLFQVSQVADSVSWNSRWLNGVAVYANKIQIERISAFRFVKHVDPMSSKTILAMHEESTELKPEKETRDLIKYQSNRMQSDSFAAHGLDGSGVRIAVLDAGFPNVDIHPAFEHLRSGKKIIDTYDFIKREKNVYKGHWHGTATLSCIAGKMDSLNIGPATGSEFLLAKTERTLLEPLSEEEHWLAAAEWADKHGANIISSSLGYGYHRYFNYEMNGRKSLVARAATIAASKGILVVNAAGNEGSNSWYYVVTPGDADSVLTVGGTNPTTDMHIFFSSFGPTIDGRLKPNVCAVGAVAAANARGYGRMTGTSFSAPLVAGFAACAWQSHREYTNMELFDAIEKSAHLYPYFDYAHGFGIPQASWFVNRKNPVEPTFDFVIINNEIKVILREQYSHTTTEDFLGYNTQRNFFYKRENKEGVILNYYVLLADNKVMLHFMSEEFQAGDVLTVHFEGYTSKLDFPESEVK
jgi:subtilisin family serine protease